MRMRTVMVGRCPWQALTREGEEEEVVAWGGEVVAAAMVEAAMTGAPMVSTTVVMWAW
jgi:hypothetical protein